MAVGQLYYKVRFADDPNTPRSSSGITEDNFFGKNNNIVKRAGDIDHFTKVGIQAPPGTKVIFNQTRTIMIGRTGIYEIEANIEHMYIERLVNYDHKIAEERELKRQGIEEMKAAETAWNTYLSSATPPAIDASAAAWTAFDEAFTTQENIYNTNFSAGLAKYYQGLNGRYERNPIKPYVDIENIIIDYQYESAEE